MSGKTNETEKSRTKYRIINKIKDIDDPVLLDRIASVIELEKQRSARRGKT